MVLCITFIINGERVKVSIIGAGVAGLTCACELLDRGISVDLYERSSQLGEAACSWYAGGMLAPWCERESAEQVVVDLGVEALTWWDRHVSSFQQSGSLVLSMQRDKRDIERFARLTGQHRWLDSSEIGTLEPELADRFDVPIVDNVTIDGSVLLVIRHVLETLRREGAQDASQPA